jgi:menaquinone-9 beta-reductase
MIRSVPDPALATRLHPEAVAGPPAPAPLAPRYDAIVVGGRCAGAATAMLLARGGARVLLVERDAAGSDTLSTHAQMRGAAMQLARWGLYARVAASGAAPIRHTRFGYGDRALDIALKPSHGVDALYAPRRHVLDAILAAAAAEAGAELRFATAFRDVLRGPGGRVTGAVLTLADGASVEVAADIVIGADGRRSSLARRMEAPVLARGRNAAAVVYAYAPGLANRGYRWHFAPGTMAGAIPTNGGLHCVFASMTPERYRAEVRPDLAAGLARGMAETAPDLADELASGRDGLHIVTRPLGFVGEPGFVRRSHGPGWALVGDAGYFRDPITSHGITDAFRDAELLARAVLAGHAGALAHYQATRDAVAHDVFAVTDRIAALDWSLDEVQALHLELNAAMKAEQAWLAALAPAPAPQPALAV